MDEKPRRQQLTDKRARRTAMTAFSLTVTSATEAAWPNVFERLVPTQTCEHRLKWNLPGVYPNGAA
jgi:hypothetical protein